ncbi:MAG: dipeptide epimerase [Clostridiales bacterium]|jgi:o-succinylbenzoate synthase|nr:dipeptide epimerase [Clostridiales bacterium]
MRITNIKTSRNTLKLKQPFITALRYVDVVESVIVNVETDDGLVGWGEAVPTGVITGDTTESIISAINNYISPAVLRHNILEEFDIVMHKLHASIHNNTSAKAAVDMALYDLLAQSLNLPLYRLLGGTRSAVKTDITISLNNIQQMITDSLEALRQGFSILKIKVGKEGLRDAVTVAEIRKAVGNSVELRVDANQGWSAKEAVRNIRAMEDYDISMVEQPVKAEDIDGLRYVTKNVCTPILADESVFSPRDAVEIITTGAADMINLKLMKTGGIYQTLKICGLAETYDVKCMMGCMMESKLSVAAAAHLACAKRVITMVDLDAPFLCAEDNYEPSDFSPQFKDSDIIMGPGAGIGVKLANKKEETI